MMVRVTGFAPARVLRLTGVLFRRVC